MGKYKLMTTKDLTEIDLHTKSLQFFLREAMNALPKEESFKTIRADLEMALAHSNDIRGLNPIKW